jgi:rhamnogalacturonan acetylesterase
MKSGWLLLALTLLIPEAQARADTPGLFIAGDSTASNGEENVWYIRQFVAESRAKGATALACSPIPRSNFNESGRLPRAGEGWGLWAGQAAQEAGRRFIDLNERIASIFEELGPDLVGPLYYAPGDHTHTSAAGAMFNARRVIEGIRELENCDLAGYLKVVSAQ